LLWYDNYLNKCMTQCDISQYFFFAIALDQKGFVQLRIMQPDSGGTFMVSFHCREQISTKNSFFNSITWLC
jgi:hypothetical protein